MVDTIADGITFLEIERLLWWPERRIRTMTKKKKNRRDQDLRVYRDI